MALGARDALGDRVEQLFVVTKEGHVDPQLQGPGSRFLESAHPVPDARSLEAGAELARRVTGLGADLWPIFLISGGSSSLVEWLKDGETLESLRALNERGLAAGWDIGKLNDERSRISRLKRGGVTRLLGRRDALALFISDVPGDDPWRDRSGLLGRARRRIDPRVIVANIESRSARRRRGRARTDARARARAFDGERDGRRASSSTRCARPARWPGVGR
jgi:hydroxypyruvate reductase